MVLDNGDYWEPEPFQLEIVDELLRGATEVWAVISEGNAKTTLTGGVALYHGDYTPTAAALMAASSRDQCGVLFSAAGGFVHRSPALRKRFRVFEGYRKIRCLRTGGEIQVFAADDRTGDGVIPTLAMLEELHRHRDLRLYRTWRGKLGKRGGQLWAISTAGEPDSEFEQIREKVRAQGKPVGKGFHVRAEVGELVLHDFAVPAGEDLSDMRVVKKANPLKAITVASLKAKRAAPTMSENHWRRFVCNQAVRVVESALDESEWARCGTDREIPADEPVWIGIDLGWKWDTTAMVPLWVPDPHERLFGRPEILTPPRDGTSLRPEVVQAAFERLEARHPVECVVMDPTSGGEQLAAWIEDRGVEVVSHGQSTAPMAIAYERFMEAIREGWIEHPRDAEFTRHVLNATARMLPDGRTKFERPSSSRSAGLQDRRVIDALIAAAMVNAVAVHHSSRSVYDDKDLLVLG